MSEHRQSRASESANEGYFAANLDTYGANVSELDTYKRIRAELDRALAGAQQLLDVGNGGVFDYATAHIPEITAVDLFADRIDAGRYPPNIRFEKGSALELPAPDGRFDTVVLVMVLHHIIGDSVAANLVNLRRCLRECSRVLKPGGKLVIAESCVPRWFYGFERLAFPLASRVVERLLTHPMAFQYTDALIAEELTAAGLSRVERLEIPKGRWVLQFGVKVPAWLSPVRMFLFSATRP